MNKKYYELAKQAGFCHWQDERWAPPGIAIDWSCDYTKEFNEFCRLIEQERLATLEQVKKAAECLIIGNRTFNCLESLRLALGMSIEEFSIFTGELIGVTYERK